MSTFAWIIAASIGGGVLSVLGAGLLALNSGSQRYIGAMVSYAIGALLGAVFLDILPEAIKTCTLVGSGVGSVRNIVLADGGTVSERLEMAHNQSVFAYSITANTALPVENYFACVTLADGANGSTDVVWASNWTAKGATEAEIKPMLEGLYTALLDGIAKAG